MAFALVKEQAIESIPRNLCLIVIVIVFNLTSEFSNATKDDSASVCYFYHHHDLSSQFAQFVAKASRRKMLCAKLSRSGGSMQPE